MFTRDKAVRGAQGIVVIKEAADELPETACLLWALFGCEFCCRLCLCPALLMRIVVFLDLIIVTISTMAAIPYGAFAACRAMKREPESDLKVSRSIPAYEPKINRKVLEYTPVKYNGKMMNSIWGLYNRYSPHNIKKSCDANLQFNYNKDLRQR